MGRPKKTVEPVEAAPQALQPEAAPQTNPATDLAQAIVEAIRSTSPIVKKTQFNKASKTPWTPKDGSPKLRVKRRSYHHGMLLADPAEANNRLSNAEIALFNKLKPGSYCDGFVKVARRRDKGIDIDYPVRTAAQRLRLVSEFGIRTFEELLQRCVDEAAKPKPIATDEDE